jgi:hypothetical protein
MLFPLRLENRLACRSGIVSNTGARQVAEKRASGGFESHTAEAGTRDIAVWHNSDRWQI